MRSFHTAFVSTGWIGIVIIVACAAISAYTGQILGRCWTIVQDRYPSLRGHVRYPYPAMGYITYGTIGRYKSSTPLSCVYVCGTEMRVCVMGEKHAHAQREREI